MRRGPAAPAGPSSSIIQLHFHFRSLFHLKMHWTVNRLSWENLEWTFKKTIIVFVRIAINQDKFVKRQLWTWIVISLSTLELCLWHKNGRYGHKDYDCEDSDDDYVAFYVAEDVYKLLLMIKGKG